MEEKMDKILFQINYDGSDDSYKFIVNEMNNREFLAFVSFLKMCVRKFEDDTYYDFFLKDEGDED